MKKWFSLFCVLLLFLGCAACGEEENLLLNGGFSEAEGGGPSGWFEDMWRQDGASSLALVDDEQRGACVYIRNDAANDARFAQTVRVEPDTLYRISALCKARGVGEEGIGANLSVQNTYEHSEDLRDTGGEWRELVLYGRTGPDVMELTVFLRLGGYSGECTGEAWFDDVRMARADTVPEGATVCSFTPIGSGGAAAEKKSDAEPERNTETWLLLIALWMVLAFAVSRKYGRSPAGCFLDTRAAFIVMIACSVLLRLCLAAAVPGYYTDINCFTSWASHMAEAGPVRFYGTVSWCDYPPVYMWMLWPTGILQQALSLAVRSGAQLILLKLWPILFDTASAYLIWRAARRLLGARPALVLSALFALDPAVFVDSAAWGQIDSVFTLMLTLCVLLVIGGRLRGGLACFALAMLTKPQAMLFAPVGLAAVVLYTLREARESEDRRLPWIRLAAAIGGALLVLYISALICCWTSSDAGIHRLFYPVRWLWELYSGTVQGYSGLTVNALNLYALLGMNWAEMAQHPVLSLLAWLLFASAYLYCGFLLIRSGKRSDLLLIGGLLIVLIFNFGPMIHERYVYPAVLLLILAYACHRDRRILLAVVVLSATLFLNEVLVLQGGMTAVNQGHLHDSEAWLNHIVSLVNVLLSVYLAWTCYDICVSGHTVRFVPCEEETDGGLSEIGDHRLRLRWTDWAMMAACAVAYAVLTFSNLGSLSAPQTTWTSGAAGEQIVFDLGETRRFRMTYYGNICSSNFMVALSNDGEAWTEPCYAEYDQGLIFRWMWFVPKDEKGATIASATVPSEDGGAYMAYAGWEGESYPYQLARYIRLTAVEAGLKLSEVAFLDEAGTPLPIRSFRQTGEAAVSDPGLLVDEQETVPAAPSWYNSMYFDEIYHGRTAYEHLHGLNTYEWTHPPLGKVLMMIGISLFGMTPFGWRFMGALMGVMMLPVMYLMVKQLTKRSSYALTAMLLLSLDSMHFTQTRIATIDSYAVFWIMLMYLFMFRFCQMPWRKEGDFARSLIPLGLCGVCMGCSWATKWIGIYASVGLAVLLFWSLYRRRREDRQAVGAALFAADGPARGYWPRFFGVILFCVGFFILVPVAIYYFSYFWHLRAGGVQSVVDMFSASQVKKVAELQKSILNYHAGLGGDTHYFRSPWYQWPVIWWPMWYYSGKGFVPDDLVSSISCLGNPAVWWVGLAALVFVLLRSASVRRAGTAQIMVLIGFASQFLPWVLVPRSTFIYHYFASVPFIIMASVLALAWLRERSARGFGIATGVLLASALILFVAFYPLESGVSVSYDYAMYLRWFRWYNFALR
ncbi:MAG: glycosyltransferase family 39 protein [Clostridia bacterium]|nr:glycosyltransferase family 39 protein [Clostridia bacterium]